MEAAGPMAVTGGYHDDGPVVERGMVEMGSFSTCVGSVHGVRGVDPVKLILKCRCGSDGHAADPEAQPWARLCGYGAAGAVRLRDRWDAPPRVGETALLDVSDPFVGEVGEPFWHLQEPEDIDIWTGHESTGKIRDILLIQSEPTELQRLDARSGLCQVKVTSVLTIEALGLLPLSEGPIPTRLIAELSYKPQVLRQGDYSYVMSEFEGDVGAFAVLRHGAAALELLLFGHWDFHADHFWAGRVDVSDRRMFFEEDVYS